MLKVAYISRLASEELDRLLTRSAADVAEVLDYVRGIVDEVRREGDRPILDWHRQVKPDLTAPELAVGRAEIEAAYDSLDPAVVSALKLARDNIRRFHEAQRERPMWVVENSPGVLLGRMTTPLERVGCYAPGGTASYPSSVLMTVVPAKAAGVEKVYLATPPGEGLALPPATLVAADLAGAEAVFKVGGPFAVAGFAFGTETMPRVDKIVGPGNKYVTAAKLLVFGRVDIDSPAGPSEALILADESADPRQVALDLLSQAEHDPDSAAVLVTTSAELAEEVRRMILELLPTLGRQDQLGPALERHSRLLVTDSLDQAVDLANRYAPEHLQIMTTDPWAVLPRIRHAGSIFLGHHAPVPVGDYLSGTNHVLPTGRAARAFSGLSIDDFLKKPTFQYLSREGLAGLKDAVVKLAEAEGLPLHAEAVKARFAK